MKLACDLCGGVLRVNGGGQDATCRNCGLCYPMTVLRQKLRLGSDVKPGVPVRPAQPAQQPVPAEVDRVSVPREEQFVMQVEKLTGRLL